MAVGRYRTLGLLLIAAIASGMLVLSTDTKEEDRTERPRLGLGYYMNDAELVGTGPDGRTLYRVKTNSATQLPDQDVIELDSVRVNYDPATEIPWTLRAKKGQILSDRNIIQLTGDVIAATQNEAEEQVLITTEYLELNTETYIADTDKDVTIEYTNNQVDATGMRAFLKEDRVQLLSNVNGSFNP